MASKARASKRQAKARKSVLKRHSRRIIVTGVVIATLSLASVVVPDGLVDYAHVTLVVTVLLEGLLSLTELIDGD